MVNLDLWKERKKQLKLSLMDISNLTEISISTLKDIFRGATTDPRIETVQRIERALGLEERENRPPSNMTESEKELFDLITQMNEEEIDELSNFIDYLLSKRK